jgi:hypothetical protein
MVFEVGVDPASLDGRRASKKAYEAAIKDAVAPASYLLTGEVKVNIAWTIDERLRYQSNKSPEIDNVVKIVLENISGPDGLLINECQVQTVSCNWVDSPVVQQNIAVEVEYNAEENVRKKGLKFVHFGRKVYMPFPGGLSRRALSNMIDFIAVGVNLHREHVDDGADYFSARNVLPSQRLFHRSRLRGFKCVEPSDVISRAA